MFNIVFISYIVVLLFNVVLYVVCILYYLVFACLNKEDERNKQKITNIKNTKIKIISIYMLPRGLRGSSAVPAPGDVM